MTALASDDFNRANNADLGANWTPLTVNFIAMKVLNNEAANGTAASNCGEYYSGSLAGGVAMPNDQYSEIIIGSLLETATDNGGLPMARIVPSSGGGDSAYFGQGNSVETRLYKIVAGSATKLGSDAAAVAIGDVLRTTCNGTSISVAKNGATIVGPVTDSSITSGNFGVGCASPTTCSLNSWEGGNLLSETFLSLPTLGPGIYQPPMGGLF